MEPATNHRSEQNIQGLALIVAPLLFAASTFFWNDDEYSTTSATLLILSLFFWIPALTGLFSLLKTKMPGYAAWGLLVAWYGCIAGVCFGFLGYLTDVFNISHSHYLKELSNYPISSQILLFATGPLFPLSIVVLAINLIRTKTAETWVGTLLCLAAVSFPASRISRIESLAHLSDVLFVVPCVYVGYLFLTHKTNRHVAAI